MVFTDSIHIQLTFTNSVGFSVYLANADKTTDYSEKY